MIERELRSAISVPHAPEVVWAAVTDWSRQGEWMLGTRVWIAGGGGDRPGSELAAFTGLGSLGVLDTMRIEVWQPPERCSVRHTGALVRGTGGFVVEPDGAGGSRFLWWERFELPTVFAVGWPLAAPAVEWGLRRSLRSFVAFCRNYETEWGER
ncbi:Polyketide cyclase / dehydrase and lipid transport [Actinopolyspora alba]|uniref:Polyketide cyclase / dehydrase and lipid transport n=1 Tax=Actinopolyspora alba TaxID=673379 RepID=A0A1I1TIA9_9ACTN|nr:SRPBCC family protein [Actinopolyspora alba]SFD58265.1 Polyketide cyclase / dehydrase and lipid transport [Actinopolyspora alba]